MIDEQIIKYSISSEKFEDFSWEFLLDPSNHRCKVTPNSQNNEWQKLESHQCKNCPYQPKNTEYCLVAQNMGAIAEYFKNISSIEIFELEVLIDDEVHFKGKSSAQRICSALLGLATSGSGCQHTQFLWPMLQQHIPMASLEDSVLRALSNMAINYVLNDSQNSEKQTDFLTSSTNQYNEMHNLNSDLSKRILSISNEDSLNNGLTNLDMFIKVILYNLNNNFEDFSDMYKQR